MAHPFEKEIAKVRQNTHTISPLIIDRWSPRAMSGETISDEELMDLFEAARWAPSSYNNQPWRFLYAKRDTSLWPLFHNLMIDFNKQWTQNAAVIAVVVSAKNFEHNGKFSRTHSFDTGAAWMALALEGSARGLVVHGMEGFDYDKAKKDLDIPDDHQVEAMIAIGKHASPQILPEEIRKRETPSTRKEVKTFVIEGKFKKN